MRNSRIWKLDIARLVEQIPAVVFMAYLDRGIGEAYVSPQIEAALGFSQEEWLEDPVRWYSHIHPDDKQRWSTEAAEMFLTGNPLRSAYRVISRDGRVIWFHCEAKMIRREDGEPWFIHGVGFDITDLKRTEEALQKERNVVSAILHTVGALWWCWILKGGLFASIVLVKDQWLYLRGGGRPENLGCVHGSGGSGPFKVRFSCNSVRTVARRL